MPLNNQRTVVVGTMTILKVIAILLLIYFLYIIRDVLLLVFVALFLATLLNPAARALARYRIPKGVTVVFLYLVMFGLAILVVGLLLPLVIDQSSQILGSFGKSWVSLAGNIQSLKQFSTTYGLSANVQAGVQSVEQQIGNAASGLVSTLENVFGGLAGLVVVLVMAYYMVVQERAARDAFRNFVPEQYKVLASTVIRRVEEKIGQWLIGQMALCLVIGVLYFIGLSVIGIQSALILSIFGGFTELVPYLGPFLGAVPVVILALSDSPFKALLACIVIVIIQQAEGHIIVPKVMQKAVGINPLVSIIALLVGAKLFGIIGLLLAIPVATALTVAISELYQYRKIANSSAE